MDSMLSVTVAARLLLAFVLVSRQEASGTQGPSLEEGLFQGRNLQYYVRVLRIASWMLDAGCFENAKSTSFRAR
jgi:hypothetical protein